MRYWSFLIMLCIVHSAFADSAANGPNGVNATVTHLTGANIPIGEVESDRSGKAGYDNAGNAASNTVPTGVFFQTSGGQDSANQHIYDPQSGEPHATKVANVMIGGSTSTTGRTVVPNYGTYAGVAPGAFLVTTASGDFDVVDLTDSLNRTALQFSNGVEAINLSFQVPLSFPDTPNGNSYFTQFLDWSARQYDVLYVTAWGNSGPQDIANRAGADQFNGIVVGASEQTMGENVWRKFSDVNATQGLGGNTNDETLHIDLLAPGKNIHVLGTNDFAEPSAMGTSFAAPLATGSAALLYEFIQQPGHTGNFFQASKHQVIKAVMMNSADKLSGVQGSFRTALNSQNMDWTQTEATSEQIALDDELGTGLLNVQRAITQLEPGRFGPAAPVPGIGWDYGEIPDQGQDTVYNVNGSGGYVSVTLAWDRPVFCTCDTTFQTGDQFVSDPIPDVDLIIEDANGTVLAEDVDQFLTVEHLFTQLPGSGPYKIVLRRNVDNAENTNYGLAWWFGNGPSIPGDYNSDGHVDAADYVVWRNDLASFGGAGGYDTWRANFGASAGSGASLASVPEPNSLLLFAVFLAFGATKRSRHTLPSHLRT